MTMRDVIRRSVGRGADAVRDRQVGTRTATSAAPLVDALARLDARDPAAPPDAAVVQLALDTESTMSQRGDGPARRLLRHTDRAGRATTRRTHWEEGRHTWMARPDTRNRLAQVAELDVRHVLMGHLSVAIARLAKPVLALLMVMVDPLNIYLTIRTKLDVPTHIGMFDFSDPSIILATAAAALVSGVLVATIGPAGKVLATLLFRGRLRPARDEHGDPVFPEAEESHRLLGPAQLGLLLVVLLGILTFFVLVLKNFAKARFEDLGLQMAITGTDPVVHWLVALIASLPIVLVVLDTVGHAPQLEHARKVSTWAMRARLRQAWDVRRDQRWLRVEHRRRSRARRAATRLWTILEDVWRRADFEAGEGAIASAKIDVAQLATLFRTKSGEQPTVGQVAAPTTTSLFLPGVRMPATIGTALTVFDRLPAVPERAPLAAAWHDLRLDPLGYCALEADGADVRPCVPGTEESAADESAVAEQPDVDGEPVTEPDVETEPGTLRAVDTDIYPDVDTDEAQAEAG